MLRNTKSEILALDYRSEHNGFSAESRDASSARKLAANPCPPPSSTTARGAEILGRLGMQRLVEFFKQNSYFINTEPPQGVVAHLYECCLSSDLSDTS